MHSLKSKRYLARATEGPYLSDESANAWRRFRAAGIGMSFESPFALEVVESREGELLERIASGRMLLPYVFEIAFVASNGPLVSTAEEMARETAVRWTKEYEFVVPPSIRRARNESVDAAWILSAEIADPAGTLAYTWVTLEVDERIFCLGLSYWATEPQAKLTCTRIIRSISGPISWV